MRISDKPADDGHHFGHSKVENLAALFEVLLQLGAAGWIVYEAGTSLLGQAYEIIAAPVVIAVLLISIVVDYFRVRALNRVAKATDSAALEADALHFLSDMLSSAVVLLGFRCDCGVDRGLFYRGRCLEVRQTFVRFADGHRARRCQRGDQRVTG